MFACGAERKATNALLRSAIGVLIVVAWSELVAVVAELRKLP